MSMYDQVKEFHKATGLPVRDMPIDPDNLSLEDAETYTLRASLVEEEYKEFEKAMDNGDLVEIADAIMDLHYVLSGTSVSFGIPEDACFREVQRSNMSKLNADGSVNRREDGKILKGDHFSEPDLESIIYAGSEA